MHIPLILLLASCAFGNELIEQTHAPNDAVCDNVKQYTGYFKLTTGQKKLFLLVF
jgi:hypothetical protein